MNASLSPTRSRRHLFLLAVLIAVEAAIVGIFLWPLGWAKWGASPDRLSTDPPAVRPANWAQPLAAPGLENLHKVNPGLYRGARPTAEGIAQLKAMGVKTVVNLEVFHSDRELLAGSGLNYVPISFKSWHPENEDMAAFLKVAADANLAPVFVHCQYGSDRTGTMCAIYRIEIDGWSKAQAIDEMVHGGFGYHADWQNLLEFIDKLDAAAIKKQAGIEK